MLEQFMNGFFLPFNGIYEIFKCIPMETVGAVCGMIVFSGMVVIILEMIAKLLSGHKY